MTLKFFAIADLSISLSPSGYLFEYLSSLTIELIIFEGISKGDSLEDNFAAIIFLFLISPETYFEILLIPGLISFK